MKILIADTYYDQFLRTLYTQNKTLHKSPYDVQWRTCMDQCFGTSDFYSHSLDDLGHRAHEIIANNSLLQHQWAKENVLKLRAAYPFFRGLRRTKNWQLLVLKAQINQFKPDVFYIQNMNWMDEGFLHDLGEKIPLIVGQTACPLRSNLKLDVYDLIISSFPHYVDKFRSQGLSSEYLPLAFEPRVLKFLSRKKDIHGVTFVGGFTSAHRQGNMIFEYLAEKIQFDCWGYGLDELPRDSFVRRHYHGESWGLEMYRILHESCVTLNRHIDVSETCANNMRLFEATGVGACLVTDAKSDLYKLFEPENELVTYDGAEDCLEKVQYLLENTKVRAEIAKAGQRRTLREHTFRQRMEQLVRILEKHLSR